MRLSTAWAAAAVLVGAAEAGATEDRDPDLDAYAPAVPRLGVRASAGGSVRGLFDTLVAGGEFDVSAGVDTRAGSYALAFGCFAGVVEGGLPLVHGAAGFDMAWPIGILRVGLRPRVGYVGVGRVTTDRQFGAYTFGLSLRASVDVVRDAGYAFALGVEPSADVAAALGNDGSAQDGAAPLYGGRAFVELRYRDVR